MRLILFALLATGCGPTSTVSDAGVLTTDAPMPATDVLETPDAPSSDATSADTAPTDAPVTTPTTREAFAARAEELICEAAARCSCTFDCTVAGDMILALPAENFRADEVEAYLAVLEEAYAACDQITSLEYADLYPIHGDGQPSELAADGTILVYGDECSTAQDCATLTCEGVTWPDGFDRGTCMPLPSPSARERICPGGV